jgi:hypothetical protein
MGLRTKLGGHGHDPKRQHPNHHDRREGDRQWACIPMVDHAFIVQAGVSQISRHRRISASAAISASGSASSHSGI